MMRRHARATFGSFYVFPGGVLDDGDAEVHGFSSGRDDVDANHTLGVESGALDYYSAAIREAFEESGILLARNARGDWGVDDASAEQLATYRESLHAGRMSWLSFLESQKLTLAYEQMHYIAYWVTPRIEARRFSTRFFLAPMPEGQVASHDDAELTDSCWMTPAAVLQASKDGEMQLMYPTRCALREIAEYSTIDEIVGWAREQEQDELIKLPPVFHEDPRDLRPIFPGEPDYPADPDL